MMTKNTSSKEKNKHAPSDYKTDYKIHVMSSPTTFKSQIHSMFTQISTTDISYWNVYYTFRSKSFSTEHTTHQRLIKMLISRCKHLKRLITSSLSKIMLPRFTTTGNDILVFYIYFSF